MAKLLLQLDFRAKIILVMLPLTLLVFVALGYYIYTSQAKTYEADGIARSKEYVNTYADEISKELGTHVDIATELASTFSAYQGIEASSRRSFYQRYINVVMKRNTRTAAAWVDFDKNALDGQDEQFKNVGIFPASGRFFMQTYRQGNNVLFQKENPNTPVETFTSEDWLDWPRKQKKSIIVEPYMWTYTNDSSNMDLMTAICVPVFNQNNEVVGVAGIDLMLKHIVEFISKIKPFGSGYATLMSENENYLAHPNNKLIEKGIADNPIFPNATIKEINKKMPTKKAFHLEFINKETNKRTFIFFAPVPIPKTDSKFMTAVVVPYEAMIAHAKESVDNIFLAFGLAIIIITILIVSVASGTTAPLRKLFKIVTQYLGQMAKGNTPEPINENQYSGDFHNVILSLNSAGKTVSELTHTTQNLLEQALNGNLNARANAENFQGDYKKLMTGVNELVNAFAEPLAIATGFVKGVAAGDANVQRFTKTYKGDFAELANAVNTTIDTLNMIVGEIMQIAQQARAGNLSQRTDVSKVKGGWRDILGSLNIIVESADDIIKDSNIVLGTMATGDLTPRIINTYSGDFKSIQDSVNNLGDSLTNLISQLQNAVNTTASASAEISATAESLAAATQEQSSQTGAVAGAMEDMAHTVANNARSVTKTADVAKRSGEIAKTGGKVVEQTVTKMKEIADVVKVSATSMVKLGESSKRIGEIISVIEDIADQTNLLSLNAAIEAARAGEQGRGFAVVADSVGKLAVSTASATKEIANMIKGIQKDTEAAVNAMEQGTIEVQSGIELADNAGQSIQDILIGINELLKMINNIAEASEKQSTTSEQISHNVSSISKVTASSARNIEDVASTAGDLAKMTETLSTLMANFKIE